MSSSSHWIKILCVRSFCGRGWTGKSIVHNKRDISLLSVILDLADVNVGAKSKGTLRDVCLKSACILLAALASRDNR